MELFETKKENPETESQKNLEKLKESILIEKFIGLSQEEQIAYLYYLSKQKAQYRTTKEIIDGVEVFGNEIAVKSGLKRIIDLKKVLDKRFKGTYNPSQKEKINQAFLTIHHFTLENTITWPGEQAIVVWNTGGKFDINDFILRSIIRKKPLYDPNETNRYLEKNEEGELLSDLMQKVKKISQQKLHELAKIKKIYDLIAYTIPHFKFFDMSNRNKIGYQTFEQLIKNKSGICTEKNALLTYALQKAGIDAYLLTLGGHVYTRIFTSEGVLDVDITSSRPFSLSEMATKPVNYFSTNKEGVDNLPENLKQFASEEPDETGYYSVAIDLNSNEAIQYFAKENPISVKKLKDLISKLCDIKPHPLYSRAKNSKIEPKNAEKYASYLFPTILK